MSSHKLDCFIAMQNSSRMHPQDLYRLQQQHNVNVHASADDCEEYLDTDETDNEWGGREDINVIEMEEFIERYVS